MSKKIENAEFAKKWLEDVFRNDVWAKSVQTSKDKTQCYRDDLISDTDRAYCKSMSDSVPTEVRITHEKTYDVIKDCYYRSNNFVCVLNFASFFNPGGGFIKGSFAQEESLCAVSGLYLVLSSLDVYKKRAERKTVPEYDDEIIYSPAVPFTLDEGNTGNPYLVDVLSCAAPNCNRIVMTQQRQYIDALNKRIEAIYLRPFLNGCETLILGAWGCGVFKNDPGLISNMFAAIMAKYPGLYHEVIFACGSKDNAEVFRNNIRA